MCGVEGEYLFLLSKISRKLQDVRGIFYFLSTFMQDWLSGLDKQKMVSSSLRGKQHLPGDQLMLVLWGDGMMSKQQYLWWAGKTMVRREMGFLGNEPRLKVTKKTMSSLSKNNQYSVYIVGWVVHQPWNAAESLIDRQETNPETRWMHSNPWSPLVVFYLPCRDKVNVTWVGKINGARVSWEVMRSSLQDVA